jgi:serine/threonine-protein kinase
VADGFHLWSDTYDRDMTNIFLIQSDIAGRVAEALKLQLGGAGEGEPIKKPTENLEAYKLYLQSRYHWNQRTSEDIKKAVEYLNQAIAKDASYALAYAGLADCYIVLPKYAGLARRDTLPKARAAALKALELDNSLVEPHATLAATKAFFDWDWLGAEAEFQRAIELNPNYATAHHWLAQSVLLPLGRHDGAVSEMRKAQGIDPLSPIINADLGENLFLGGHEDLAIAVLQKQIALDRSFPKAHEILGRVYLKKGKPKEAVEELETMRRLEGSGTYGLASLGFAYARTGRTNDAQQILRDMLKLQQQGTDCQVGIALVQHGLGEDEQALDSLEKSLGENATGLQYLNVDPFWKDLRSHRRVQAILKKMNLVK